MFVTIDSARGPALRLPLPARDARVASLYAGHAAESLSDVAPQLVGIGENLTLLERLLVEGWGNSSLVFLSCDQPFDAVRRHLRRFLKVRIEDGNELYFRFYDPRVLRVFLPTCTRDQLREFFGPVSAFWVEGEDPRTCHVFRQGRTGLQIEVLDLHT